MWKQPQVGVSASEELAVANRSIRAINPGKY